MIDTVPAPQVQAEFSAQRSTGRASEVPANPHTPCMMSGLPPTGPPKPMSGLPPTGRTSEALRTAPVHTAHCTLHCTVHCTLRCTGIHCAACTVYFTALHGLQCVIALSRRGVGGVVVRGAGYSSCKERT